MRSEPSVSVIVIFFEAERFLREAIESVLTQTYASWELLLVDDGSSDGSTAIARAYAEQAPDRIRVLEHPGHANRGMSASRNLGARDAAGQYIAYLDADDVWFPNTLEQQVALLDAHPDAAMVYGPVQWWFSWTGNARDAERDYVETLGVPPDTLIMPPTLLPLFLQDKATVPSGLLIRREAFEQVGGFEDAFRGEYEDQAFCAKICLHAPVFASSQCWYRYRQHPDSCVSVGMETGHTHAARLNFLTWLAQYLGDRGIKDDSVWQALRAELWPYRHPVLRRLRRGKQRIMQCAIGLPLSLGKRTLPRRLRGRLRATWEAHKRWPPVGMVRFGSLRRVMPISRDWGFDRGLPIDRYYIERFLADNAQCVRGRVLEVADPTYTRRYGGDRVTCSDVLHAVPGNPIATVVGDLARGTGIPSHAFDCVILTQTLQLIYDVHAAVRTAYRILKPGGVLLVTVPGISQISRYDMERWGYYWSFTTASARRLFQEVFPPAAVEVQAYGNVLAAIALLHGLATRELAPAELNYRDPDYEVLITIKAVKPLLPVAGLE